MISVSEIFYSIQGEGATAGQSAVFLRLAGCNLNCGQNGGWVCDSLAIWQKGYAFKTSEDLFEEFKMRGLHADLLAGAHLVITGGEPLLQQEAIIDFLKVLNKELASYPLFVFRKRVFVEIETNGTKIIHPDLLELIDQVNISIKLSNSGNSQTKRINPDAIKDFVCIGYFKAKWHDKICWKFVVQDERDVLESQQLCMQFEIPPRRVWLMPACNSSKELAERLPTVIDLAKKYHCSVSNRLQVQVWDKKTGV